MSDLAKEIELSRWEIERQRDEARDRIDQLEAQDEVHWRTRRTLLGRITQLESVLQSLMDFCDPDSVADQLTDSSLRSEAEAAFDKAWAVLKAKQ